LFLGRLARDYIVKRGILCPGLIFYLAHVSIYGKGIKLTDIPSFSNLLAKSNGPPWLPPAAADARKFAYYGQLVLGLFFIIGLIGGIINIVFNGFFIGVYMLISAAVDLLLVFLMNSTVFEPIDQGRFREAGDHLLIWGVLGLIFGVIPGILILIGFIRMQEVFQPQYNQYPTQYYQQPQQYPGQAPPVPPAPYQYPQQPQYQQPPQAQYPQYQPAPQQSPPAPQQYQAPPPPVAPQPAPQPAAPAPAPASAEHKADMSKCKNCGVQYPAFMRNCPNCGTPRQ
jgi:hypothetical protein